MFILSLLITSLVYPLLTLMGVFQFNEPDIGYRGHVFDNGTPDWIDFTSFLSAILFLVMVFGVVEQMLRHWKNLALIRRQQEYIRIREEARDNLKGHINETVNVDGKVLETMLANADSPVEQMLEELGKAERNLANAKNAVETAHREILEREIGFFWFIVKIWGKE